MRLNVKYNSKLTKTNKQKKANMEKKSKGPKISKNYADTSEYKHDNVTVDLTKLTYGMIDSCDVDYIVVPEGTVDLKGSWLQLLLFMIHNLITNYPDSFTQLLGDNEVTSQFFCIDKVYGKYTFDKEQYKAYKIFDSGYYLEAIFTSDVIFRAILGLTKSLGISLDEIQFHLRNKKFKDIDLNFNLLEDTETVVNINEVSSMLKQGIHMISIDILGVSTRVHRIDVALVVFCNWIYENYGIDKLISIGKNKNTGISVGSNKEDIPSTAIKDSGAFVYTDGNEEDIVAFILNSLDKLEIGYDKIKFKFRALKKKEELKEWECE